MNKRCVFWGAVLVSLLGMGVALAGEEVVTDGVLHIVNGSEPSEGVEHLHFEEVWRAGGEDGEDFFGLITQVVVGEEGSVYLLDTRLSEVPVYSPEGERIDTLSREGEGPGETRMPTNLFLMSDGSLGLVQRFPGKIIKIDLQGNPVGDVEPKLEGGGFLGLYDCFSGGGDQLTMVGQTFKQGGPTSRTEINFVSNFSADGTETVRFTEMVREMDFSNFRFDENEQNEVTFRKAVVSSDGQVYLNKIRNRYEIEVYRPDGTLDRVIERSYEHRKRSDEEYQRVHDLAETQLAQVPGAKFEISRIEPDISGIQLAPNGDLWVTSSHSTFEQADGVLITYDVFSQDGHFIKQVAVHCEGDGMEDSLFWAPNGDAVLVTGFTDALMSLQTGGRSAGGEDEDEEAMPMEVIYLKQGK